MRKQNFFAEMLKRKIESGEYQSGTRLPSEYILSEEFGANRITINKAVNALIADGYLRRGTSSRDGTYICDRSNIAAGNIGLMVRCDNIYSSTILKGVFDGTNRNNYLMTVMSPEPDELPLAIQKMAANHIEAIFLACYANASLDMPTAGCRDELHRQSTRQRLAGSAGLLR